MPAQLRGCLRGKPAPQQQRARRASPAGEIAAGGIALCEQEAQQGAGKIVEGKNPVYGRRLKFDARSAQMEDATVHFWAGGREKRGWQSTCLSSRVIRAAPSQLPLCAEDVILLDMACVCREVNPMGNSRNSPCM